MSNAAAVREVGSASSSVRIGAFTLETLTTGMYSDPLDAIREYVQNSLDGINEAKHQGVISDEKGFIDILVDRASRRLVIWDNGIGLGPSEAFEALTSVGMSRKDPGRSAGFRGIGRLAGIAYCSTLTFRSSHAEEAVISIVSFDCVALRKAIVPTAKAEDLSALIRRCVHHAQEPGMAGDHFFEVTLENVSESPAALLDSKELEQYLCQRSPVDFDSQKWPYRDTVLDSLKATSHRLPTVLMTIRDERGEAFPVLKPYRTHYKTERKNDSCRITGVSMLHPAEKQSGWWGWVGESDLQGAIDDRKTSGIRVRAKNLQIGDRNIMDDVFRSVSESYGRFNAWFIGEIHIEDPGVIPNGRRDGFEDTPAWNRIRADLVELARGLSGKCYQQSQDRRKSVRKIEREVEDIVEKTEDLLHKGVESREQRDTAKEALADRRTRVEAALRLERPEQEQKSIKKAIERLKKLEKRLDNVQKFGADAALSRLDRKQRLVVRTIFEVLNEELDAKTFERVQRAILDRFGAGNQDKR